MFERTIELRTVVSLLGFVEKWGATEASRFMLVTFIER